MKCAVVNGNTAVASLPLVELRLKALGLGSGGLGLLVDHQFIVHSKLTLWHTTEVALHHNSPRDVGTEGLPCVEGDHNGGVRVRE